MVSFTRTSDAKARVSLPASFANATLLIDEVSDTELRIRKAQVIPEDELPFREEAATVLGDVDREAFLSLLESPPPANKALKRAARRKRRNG